MDTLTNTELELEKKYGTYVIGKWLFLILCALFLTGAIQFHFAHQGEQNESLVTLAAFQACLICFFVYQNIKAKLLHISLIKRIKGNGRA